VETTKTKHSWDEHNGGMGVPFWRRPGTDFLTESLRNAQINGVEDHAHRDGCRGYSIQIPDEYLMIDISHSMILYVRPNHARQKWLWRWLS
jgi:hypothetical protein